MRNGELKSSAGWRRILIILAVALITAGGVGVRLAAVARTAERSNDKLGFDAYYYYVSTAESLLAGRGFDPAYNHRVPAPPPLVPPPLQAWFVAAVYKLRGAAEIMAVYYAQVVLNVAAGWLVLLILLRWRGWPEALAGLAGWMFYPEFGAWVGTALTESNFYFWLVLALWGVERWSATRKTGWAAAAAVAIGLANLQRPTMLMMGAALAALEVWSAERGARRKHNETQDFSPRSPLRAPHLRIPQSAIIFLVVPHLVLAPWMVRNWVVTGDPVWVSSNGGILFYAVNHHGFDPVRYPDYGVYPDSVWVRPDVMARFNGPEFEGRRTYYRLSKLYFAEAERYLVREPVEFLKNNAIKLWQRFTRVPKGIGDFYPWLPAGVSIGMFYGLLALGLAGLAGLAGGRGAWRHPTHRALATCFACTTLFTALMHNLPSGRMALPLRVYFLLFAAVAVGGAARRAAGRVAGEGAVRRGRHPGVDGQE